MDFSSFTEPAARRELAERARCELTPTSCELSVGIATALSLGSNAQRSGPQAGRARLSDQATRLPFNGLFDMFPICKSGAGLVHERLELIESKRPESRVRSGHNLAAIFRGEASSINQHRIGLLRMGTIASGLSDSRKVNIRLIQW